MLDQSRRQGLLVDDDESTREMMGFLLKPLGLSLIAVPTAHQALTLINCTRFDLYILDVWLPQIDGFALCNTIRALDQTGKILFYSGSASGGDVERGRMAGADAYVIKPDIIGLISGVEKLVKMADLPYSVSSKNSNYLSLAAAMR